MFTIKPPTVGVLVLRVIAQFDMNTLHRKV